MTTILFNVVIPLSFPCSLANNFFHRLTGGKDWGGGDKNLPDVH